jgi:hypothetical protein
MPKIGKHEFTIAGERHFLDISYFKKEKKFAIKMPENMATALRGWSDTDAGKYKMIDVFGATEDETINAFEKEIKDYEAAVTKKDKVILYAVAGSSAAPGAERMDLEKIAHELKNWGRKPEWIGLLVKHRVAYKTTVDSHISYRDENGQEIGFDWRPRDKDSLVRAIDWTPEREEFFITIKSQLERMVEKAAAFLDREPEAMIEFIDSHGGGTLLTGPKA